VCSQAICVNEILFNDKFQNAWCCETLSVAKTLKPCKSSLYSFKKHWTICLE
jgi:hypothetical protein